MGCPHFLHSCRVHLELTNANVLVIQLGRAIAIVAQAAVLTVLASSVVFAADAGHHVQEVNVAAAVGVAVALAVWTSQVGETPVVSDTEKGTTKHMQGRWQETPLGGGSGRGFRSGALR